MLDLHGRHPGKIDDGSANDFTGIPVKGRGPMCKTDHLLRVRFYTLAAEHATGLAGLGGLAVQTVSVF